MKVRKEDRKNKENAKWRVKERKKKERKKEKRIIKKESKKERLDGRKTRRPWQTKENCRIFHSIFWIQLNRLSHYLTSLLSHRNISYLSLFNRWLYLYNVISTTCSSDSWQRNRKSCVIELRLLWPQLPITTFLYHHLHQFILAPQQTAWFRLVDNFNNKLFTIRVIAIFN